MLCEKPLAVNSTKHVAWLMQHRVVGLCFRWDQSSALSRMFKKAREILEAGTLGEIILYENTFAGFVDMSRAGILNRKSVVAVY